MKREEDQPNAALLLRSIKGAFGSLGNARGKTFSDSQQTFTESTPGPSSRNQLQMHLSQYVHPFDVGLVKILHIRWY